MAKKDVTKKLNQLINKMSKSAQFRRLVTNKEAQYFIIHVDDLKKQIRYQVTSAQNNPQAALPKGLETLIEKEAKLLLNRVAKSLRKTTFGRRKISQVYRNYTPNVFFEMAVEQVQGTSTANVFGFFQNACSKAQKISLQRINKKIREYKTREVNEVQTSLLDVGHIGDTENMRKLVLSVLEGLISLRTTPTSGITKFVDSLEDKIQIRLQKVPVKIPRNGGIKKGKYVILTLESSRLNRAASELRALSKDITEILIQARNTVDFSTLRGSSNIVEELENYIDDIYYRKILRTLAKERIAFRASGGNLKSLKKKLTPTLAKKTINVKANAGLAFQFNEEVDIDVGQMKPPQSAITLRTLLDRKLPAQVAANMGDPRLNYQTGRFAASVGIVNVGKLSKKGPLSVGYRYQTDPYDVFEKGGSKYKPERDPNDLIGKSIREIAAEIKITNLTTRKMS